MIIIGDWTKELKRFRDNVFHCCVTSPPYYNLRDYHVVGQLGHEETPEKYIQKLVEGFREVKRVLRNDATLWVVIGDCYISKNLVGIPWMFAFAMRSDGWWLRKEIIWHKPNPMTELVKDRPTSAHETIFLFSKSKKYFYDMDAIREPCVIASKEGKVNIVNRKGNPDRSDNATHRARYAKGSSMPPLNPDGKNKRDVWTITTKPYRGDHFAAFPPDIPEICIKAGTSVIGCCPVCGAPIKRITQSIKPNVSNEEKIAELAKKGIPRTTANLYATRQRGTSMTIGWKATCEHSRALDPIPCVVLDPFAGSGTTGMVASKLGRDFVLIDINPKYEIFMLDRLEEGK